MATQSIAAKIMNDLGYGNLGLINIAIVYLSFALTSILASSINKKLGTKWTLVASALTYAFWVSAFLLPARKYDLGEEATSFIYSDGVIVTASLLSALFLGLGAGNLWVS